jgi:hypothetical protein
MAEEEHRRRLSLRIDPSELALEIISIVIAIILATAVGQIIANYQAESRTREALNQIRQEVAQDDAALRDVQPLHRRVLSAFTETLHRTAGERLDFDEFTRAFGRAAPTGFHPFFGTTTAWDLARGSNVLANLPYALRATLQTRYAELAQLQTLNAGVFAHLTSTPTDSRPNFFFTAATLSLNLSDVAFSEDRLRRDDEAALHMLAANGVR